MSAHENGERTHEPERERFGALLAVAAVVIGVLVIAHVAIRFGFEAVPTTPPEAEPAEAVGAAAVAEDFDELDRRRREHLESSGWVDRQRGIAHIPIERAMQSVVERNRAGDASPVRDTTRSQAIRHGTSNEDDGVPGDDDS